MGLFRKKKAKEATGPRLMRLTLTRPEGLPESLVPSEVVAVVRWVNDTGHEEVTTEVFAEVMQPTPTIQAELGLGMLHIAATRLGNELSQRRKQEMEDAEVRTCGGPNSVIDLPDLEAGGYWNLAGEFISNEDGTVLEKVVPRHDHPCGDPRCEECWRLTSKLGEPEGADFDKPGFVPPARQGKGF